MIPQAPVAFLLLVFALGYIGGNPLVGEPFYCSKEGAPVKVSSALLGNNSCLICFCRNHTVQCNNPLECPSTEGCYRLQRKNTSECCRTCLGCLWKDKEVTHGSSWHDGCQAHECQAGVLTSYQTQCHTTCSNPKPSKNGGCCPRCEGCWLESQLIPERGTGSPRLDPCVKCQCLNGQLICVKRSCPVLSCPPNRALPDADGCCQTCNGSREIYALPRGRCFLGKYLYQSGDNRTFDECTTCSCNKGFLTCQRQTCPALQCPERYRQTKRGKCCPQCVYPTLSQVCIHSGTVRDHGDRWHLDQCKMCSCDHGRVTCEVTYCEYQTKDCPPGFRKVQPADECCPRCVENSGICVLYGEPHYKTFDGYAFNFQGECRYELVRDCAHKKFSLRVNNAGRSSRYMSWTRSLLLKVTLGKYKHKINLGQRLRTKVDRKRVKLPFEKDGLNITRDGFSAQVLTPIGLKVIWDGANYVEVELQPEWHNITCGLCGNFNGNKTDDKMTKKGLLAPTDEEMANSWQSGKTKSCSRRLKRLHKEENTKTPIRTQRLTCPNSPLHSRRRCEALNDTYFEVCRQKVAVDRYYRSCMSDLCECPSSRMCECDVLLAFKRDCERAGIDVSRWNAVTKCGGFDCPYGAMFMECAPACKPTCKNPEPNTDCYMRRCKPGCYCPPSKVLHKGSCIEPENCPKKRKKFRKG